MRISIDKRFSGDLSGICMAPRGGRIYIHKYIEGQQFSKHADTYYKTQIHNVGVCLNNDYDG